METAKRPTNEGGRPRARPPPSATTVSHPVVPPHRTPPATFLLGPISATPVSQPVAASAQEATGSSPRIVTPARCGRPFARSGPGQRAPQSLSRNKGTNAFPASPKPVPSARIRNLQEPIHIGKGYPDPLSFEHPLPFESILFIFEKRQTLKRIADIVEKFSVGSILIGLYQDNRLATALGLLAILACLVLTRRLSK